MKVKSIMAKEVGFCHPTDNFSKAVEIMRQKDCGVVPIVDEKKKVVGIITDRDICIALASQNKKASEIKVSEVIKSKIVVCAESDDAETVLKRMKRKQIKRLPVVSKKRELVGILSITDVLLAAEKDKKLRKKVYSTLKAIGKPHPIILKEISATAVKSAA